MTKTTFLGGAAVLGLLAAPAAGQDGAAEPFDLGTVVFSATLAPLTLNRTGAAVSLIDEEELAEGPIGLVGTLDRTPGVSVTQNGGLGTNAAVRIRGLDGKYVGVRVNGIDVTDPSSTQTQFNFGGLVGAGLGRLEVLKGSQSALYGSSAVGGVIDIATDRGGAPGTRGDVVLEGGAFGTGLAALGLAARDERGGLSFSVSRVTSDGFSARAGDDEEDGLDATFAAWAGDHAVGEAVTLGFSGIWRDSEVEFDRSTSDPSGVFDTVQRGGRAYAEIRAGGIDHTIFASRFTSERRDPGGFTERFDGARDEVGYLGTAFLGLHSLSFGVERMDKSFESDDGSGQRRTDSALAELLMLPAPTLDVALSLRHDEVDDFGGELSGRIALSWRATAGMTVRAVAGTGFRAPSLYERFGPYGAADLSAENSRSYEIGLERRFGGSGAVTATAFHTEIDDLIAFDFGSTTCGSDFGCYAQVPGSTTVRGVEISGRRELGDRIALRGNYTLTDTESEGGRLGRVPRHDLSLGVEASVTGRVSGSLDARMAFDVEPGAFDPEDGNAGDYQVVDLGLAYAVQDAAEAYLRVENLLDENYETAAGFNTSDRALYVGLRASF